MPAKTGSRNGLAYGWALGENNWNVGMDGNLSFIDRFGLHLSFKSFLNTPPGSPAAGDCYVIDAAPTGAWVGKTGQVAVYDDGAWRYAVPRTGWQAYCEADEGRYVFDGAWNLLAVGDISGLTAALGAKADLVGGVVPSNQLPSYVDDVIEVADFASLPVTGETGKIYVTLADNNSWRWTGSTYQKVSQPLDEMPQVVAEAGTSETLYAATSRRIRQAIAAWWNITDAPSDNETYGRKNGAWVEVVSGWGGGGVLIAAATHAATSKTTPADADEVPLSDSASSWALKKLTWADLKATIKAALTKGDVGLGNVDNTSDMAKPVSTATQEALDGKETAGAALSAVTAHESAGDPHPQYQVDLVSGTNIKTINNQSILGAGNITVGQMAGFIGVQGGQGFGVGIYPFALPSGFSALDGSENPASANYGNYQYTDGSIMVFIPRFYYRIGSAASPRYATYGANAIDIVGIDTYATEAAANTAGYAMHRAFKDGGADKSGFFIDKYLASKNGTTSCKSVPNGVPISLTTNSISWNSSYGMTTGEGSCAGPLADAVLLARSRLVGTFHVASVFMHSALALLSLAHAQASNNTTYCAWYDATYNFPKGCNNSLGDINDAGVTYTSAGDSGSANKPKTGSGSPFAKTTHNGQACGVADLNGVMYQVMLGITNAGENATDTTQQTDGNAYVLKTSVALSSLTHGWNGTNDAWGDATNLATKYDLETGLFPWGATTGGTSFGSGSNQVFSGATSGISWKRTACGIQDTTSGTSGTGTSQFGNDGCSLANRANLFVTSVTYWDGGAWAGVFSRSYVNSKSHASGHFGFRAGAYGS